MPQQHEKERKKLEKKKNNRNNGIAKFLSVVETNTFTVIPNFISMGGRSALLLLLFPHPSSSIALKEHTCIKNMQDKNILDTNCCSRCLFSDICVFNVKYAGKF